MIEGYIDDAPVDPFDAATCLLTLHFPDPAAREDTVRAIHRRLKPGAPFVAVHASNPQNASHSRWTMRYEAYAVASGADREQAAKARGAVEAHLHTLAPEADAAVLRAGGFEGIELFFAAFTWRG